MNLILPEQPDERRTATAIYDELLKRRRHRTLLNLFPEYGRLARHAYPKHMEFFSAGRSYMERCFMAGNRVGKTFAGGYELACHACGFYQPWWPGRRFARPISCIAAGRTTKTTRDVLQRKLLGKPTVISKVKTIDGSGIIPPEWIGKPKWGQGGGDTIDSVPIRSLFGGWSELKFRSYEQGAGAFEGTEEDAILLDEEPTLEVYAEALIRLTSTTGRFEDNGLLMLTFTPLLGYSDVVLQFMPEDMRPMPPPGNSEFEFEDAA
jgi:phage terminase large subunit-like protein